ncbi:MAG: gas vesicle protein GvpG [Trebonia sp.]
MDLLTLLFRLPFLPVKGVIKLTELISDEADRELHDPARIRRELEDAQRRYDAGEISDEELARIEDNATELLVGEMSAGNLADDDRS